MEDFVLLTERYGLKTQVKSAPMAELKRLVNSNNGSGDDAGDEMPKSKFSPVNAVYDLLGDFTGFDHEAKNGFGDLGKNEDGFDDLIPGFGASDQPSNSEKTMWTISPDDPFEVIEDLSPLFGADPSRGEFEESDKRRTARWEREERIKNQVAKAIADMNSRDREIQSEQEERSMISETLDAEIKLWAAGKEGNMRALLLSSLHLVLWPGCGWEAVSLTDLITSAAVKKVYKKANLYVHPDKVQQKGAQQKYIAEKVFNILKEAWNKFNKEELS
ncbi:hypothetical protein AALP_AA2G215200 [Arabis alpina]|uniref:J domain-containing protein n=1 Tax=Arabis alpina TaxID=50452 RepID=A0A087HJ29_ARAAL|nr:hypothetical protein AALP_AA2G215200 [Arabis alpina]